MSKKMIHYKTSDIYFASYLCALDLDLVNTEEQKGSDNNRKLVFVFKVPEPDIGRLKASYFGNRATIKVRSFVDNLKSLKSMIHT
jgi:hypothetical protein